MDRVVVYDVAASTSGALGILEDFYEQAINDPSCEYLFLVSTSKLQPTDNVKIKAYPWIKRTWVHRLFFDWIIAPRLVKQVAPNFVLSLQNTRIPRVGISQVVYEHNSLPKPFCEVSFSLLKEPNLWVRQNILGRMIISSLKGADGVIVQSEWMKKRCVDGLGIASTKIEVRPPRIKNLPKTHYEKQNTTTFFYPATHVTFKNHALILDACRMINSNASMGSYRVLFTLSGDEDKSTREMRRIVEEEKLPIEFVGWMKRDDVYEQYSRSVLLFPSRVESFPLPLYEASSIHAPIIAPNQPYAREALADVLDCSFYQQDDPVSLCAAMRLYIREGHDSV